jgi:hypothetical protein
VIKEPDVIIAKTLFPSFEELAKKASIRLKKNSQPATWLNILISFALMLLFTAIRQRKLHKS